MSWFPHGPDFVFAPREGNFKRLSRRNAWGRQGLVSAIAVDPTDPATIYVVERPSSGGTTAFRTQSEGALWTPIADSLQRNDANVDPSCIAVNPAHPEIVYMGTWANTGVYVSGNRGDTWGARNPIPANVRRLIVDPRTAADPATTVLYAVTNGGVFRSPDGGVTWAQVLAGDVWSLAAYIPAAGTPQFYAGVYGQGVFHTTDPTAAANWTNLNTLGIGLPAHSAPSVSEPEGNFNAILLDYCPRNPNRVYAWMTKQQCDAMGQGCNQVTAALYTTAAPLTAWTAVPMTSPPGPSYWFYNFTFAVAPNSPGDGAGDVLFFGSIGLHRSTDAGQTWQNDANGYHADQHAFAFFPESPAAGVIPYMYVGCDGGLGVSSKFADPAGPFTTAATDFNHDLGYSDSLLYQNFNHAKQSSALYQYNSDPSAAALGYIGCQDTGVGAGGGALGWRGIADADAGSIAVARGADGVKVWGILGAFGDWPGFRIWMWTDKGEFGPGVVQASLGAGGPLLAGPSNYVVGLDGKCLAGVIVRDSDRTLSAGVTATGVQAATPSSMASIAATEVLIIDTGASQEAVTVTASTATTFTANFSKTHAAGALVQIQRAFVARIGQDGVAAKISQHFGQNNRVVSIVAASPTNADVLFAATSDQRLWTTNVGSTATSATVWTEVTGGKPAGLSMSDIALDTGSNAFVLLTDSVTTGGGEFAVTSPLFKIAGGNWVHQSCAGLPAGFWFGKLVADPVQPDTLYASHGARVFRLTLKAGAWNWQDVSDGLPGQWIYDLWVGNINPGGAARVLLRAGIPTRGVWELDVTAGAADPPIALYVRDNLLDQGWPGVAPDGAPNPYNPAEAVYHYQCADLKIDARQSGTAAVAPFFQTDPEGGTVITHVLFDQLKDNSQNLPGNNVARVHVQVRNRSRTPANNVRVWATYCNASAGVPALSASPWQSVGPPQLLSGIDAANPRVASWDWAVPLLPSGDPGHYCMAVFVHSAASPINETSFDVDEMTPRNRQVGQKNLHIGPPLPPAPPGGGPGGGRGGVPGGPHMTEYVEFHNASAFPREATLVFDLRGLPAGLRASVRLTRLDTAAPLADSVTGIAGTRRPGLPARLAACLGTFLRWLGWLLQGLGCAIENLGRRLLRLPLKACWVKPREKFPPFEPTIYDLRPSAVAEVRGVRLGPFGTCAALLEVANTGVTEPGCTLRFEVQQHVGGQVVGGSTYVVCIAGRPKPQPVVVATSHRADLSLEELNRIEREAEALKYVPPHARRIVEQREREQGRRP